MNHSVIAWDCSLRNFFHLIDALLVQDYDRDQFELIFVEQRSREHADAYNHRQGLKSLWDRCEEVKDHLDLKVVYLDDALDVSYHWGRCNNAGLAQAQGAIISVMDGDQLLPRKFLTALTQFHDQHRGVVNLDRRMCKYPVGVRSYRDWTRAVFDFDRCLDACADRNRAVPRKAGSAGPMISARRDDWDMIGGYDPHVIWSTSASIAGGEVNTRLEIATGTESLALPGVFAVHPWHPSDYLRKTRHTSTGIFSDDFRQTCFTVLLGLINWSVEHRAPHWEQRIEETNRVYAMHREVVETLIELEPLNSEEGPIPADNLGRSTLPPMLEARLKNLRGQHRRPVRVFVQAGLKALSRWSQN